MLLVYDPDAITIPIDPKLPFDSPRGLTGRERLLFYYVEYLKSSNQNVTVFSKFTQEHDDGPITYVNRLPDQRDLVVHFGKYRTQHGGKRNILVYPYVKSAGTGRHLYQELTRVVVPNEVGRWNICDGIYLNLEDVNKFRSFKFTAPSISRSRIDPKVVYSSRWDKGLVEVLSAWPMVHMANPEAKLILPNVINQLDRYLSWERDRSIGVNGTQVEWGRRARYCKSLFNKLYDCGIESPKSLSVNGVRKHITSASVLLYPANGIENYTYHASSVYDASLCGTPVLAQGSKSFYEMDYRHISYVNMNDRLAFSSSILNLLSSPKTFKSRDPGSYEQLHRIVISA